MKFSELVRLIEKEMIDLDYSLTIEATDDPTFFTFFSTDLKGFSGVGHSIEDRMYQARWAMKEHMELLRETGRPVPPPSNDPTVTIRNTSLSTAI